MKTPTLPAESDHSCSCCHRMHRKLFLIDGYWLGETCAEHYSFYVREPQLTSSYWIGYERQHAKVRRMVTGR